MNTYRFVSNLGLLGLVFALSPASFGAIPPEVDDTSPQIATEQTLLVAVDQLGAPFTIIAIPPGLNESDGLRACKRAARGRKWTIVATRDNIMQINLIHKGWDATVYFLIKDGAIAMYSDSYTINKKTGEHKAKKDPIGWLKNLEKDINVFINDAPNAA